MITSLGIGPPHSPVCTFGSSYPSVLVYQDLPGSLLPLLAFSRLYAQQRGRGVASLHLPPIIFVMLSLHKRGPDPKLIENVNTLRYKKSKKHAHSNTDEMTIETQHNAEEA